MGHWGDQLVFGQRPRRSGCVTTLAVVALALVLLFGCGGDPSLKSGTVIAHDYDAERTWTTTYCASYSKNMICTLWLPQTHHSPERWRVKVRGQVDGETYEQWKDVGTREAWNAYQEGTAWP